MKKGALATSIAGASKWRAFDQTLAEVRNEFADIPPEEPESAIDEAVAAAPKTSVPKGG